MAEQLIMLEDSTERLGRFAAVVPSVAPAIHFIHWRNAHRMIRECEPYLSSCRLICLDHDLEPEDESDPGDGLMVAKFLAAKLPRCPILIHSSNGEGARRMVGEFELVGIEAKTILPLGADWIENYWRRRVESLLGPDSKMRPA